MRTTPAVAVRWARRLFVPLAGLGFVAGFQLNVGDMSLESRAYPQLVMVVLAGLLIATLVVEVGRGLAERTPVADEETDGTPGQAVAANEDDADRVSGGPVVRVTVVLAATGLYIWFLASWLGIFTASFVYAVGVGWVLGFRSLLWLLAVGAGLTLACYVLFEVVFALPLPSGLLF